MGSSHLKEKFRSKKREFIQDHKSPLDPGVLTSSVIQTVGLHPDTPTERKKPGHSHN